VRPRDDPPTARVDRPLPQYGASEHQRPAGVALIEALLRLFERVSQPIGQREIVENIAAAAGQAIKQTHG
jgi:hypothetical protein